MSHPTLRYLAGLGLAAGLLLGCQDFLNNSDKKSEVVTTTDDGATGSLSLSIKDDSSCREQWRSILDARTAGRADSAAEMVFLSTCVKEVVVTKDMPKPTIPPALLPDSGTRCRWIVSQIEGGRDSLTVSYKKYCPEDCRKLEIHDTVAHERLCHDPIPPIPPKPLPDDTCRMLAEKLRLTKPGEPGRAELEHNFLARKCGDLPHDTIVVPPKPLPDDTCRMLREKLAATHPGDAGRADLEHMFAARKCGDLPKDTVIVHPPMTDHDSICMDLKLRLSAATSDAQRAELEAAFKAKCMVVVPPKDTVVIKPPLVNCDELRKKLAGLDPASDSAQRLMVTLKEHCPEKPPVITDPKPPMTAHDSICADLKLRLSKATTDAQRAELEAAFKAKCMDPVPVPVPPVTTVNCDELRKKLAGLDPASADAIRIAGSIKEHCPDAPVVK